MHFYNSLVLKDTIYLFKTLFPTQDMSQAIHCSINISVFRRNTILRTSSSKFHDQYQTWHAHCSEPSLFHSYTIEQSLFTNHCHLKPISKGMVSIITILTCSNLRFNIYSYKLCILICNTLPRVTVGHFTWWSS